jgi:hypothetical protein
VERALQTPLRNWSATSWRSRDYGQIDAAFFEARRPPRKFCQQSETKYFFSCFDWMRPFMSTKFAAAIVIAITLPGLCHVKQVEAVFGP